MKVTLGLVLCSLVAGQDPVHIGELSWQGLAAKDGAGAVHELRLRGWLTLPGAGGARQGDAAAAEFATAWRAAHPAASGRVGHSFDLLGTRVHWLLVTDGESNLNVELVRAGWLRADTMTPLAGDELTLAPAEGDAFAAAVRTAEFDALDGERGIWDQQGMAGPRQGALGDWHFEGDEFERALACYDQALALGHQDVLAGQRRAECLWRLGRMDEADLAAEAALLEQFGDMFSFAFEDLLKKRARRDGREATVTWGRSWVEWDEARDGAELGYCRFLLGAGLADVATPRLERYVERLEVELGISFDERGRLRWVEELRQQQLGAQGNVIRLLPAYELVAAACAREHHDERAARWRARGAAMERVLMRLDTTQLAPAPFEDAARLDDATLAACLADPHPAARKLAAAEIAAGLETVEADALRQFCGGALAAQAQPGAIWFEDLGRIIEAGWARGLLTEAERRRYLTQGITGADLYPDFSVIGKPADFDEVSVSLWLRQRFSPPPMVSRPDRDDVALELGVVRLVVLVDGRPAAVMPLHDGDTAEQLDVSDLAGAFRVKWRPVPGRHVVDLQGTLRVTCRGKDGRDATTVNLPLVARGAFFWDGAR